MSAAGDVFMHWYKIEKTLIPLECEPTDDTAAIVLLSSTELERHPRLSGLEEVLSHLSEVHEARLCKAEAHAQCLTGILALPCTAKSALHRTYRYLLTQNRVVLLDDTDFLLLYLQRFIDDKLPVYGRVGTFFYELLERLRAGDLHHLEEIENRIEALEEDVLSDKINKFSVSMTGLRKETTAWFRYYVQLDDMVCELQENENGFFIEDELRQFHLLEERCSRLREEAQLLREYCMQVQGMFQAEIGIRQNRIMKILTIVTTIFLPLSLLVGWYGMNFVGMPELRWKYGYPAVIISSIAIVITSLWICKKKKFW